MFLYPTVYWLPRAGTKGKTFEFMEFKITMLPPPVVKRIEVPGRKKKTTTKLIPIFLPKPLRTD